MYWDQESVGLLLLDLLLARCHRPVLPIRGRYRRLLVGGPFCCCGDDRVLSVLRVFDLRLRGGGIFDEGLRQFIDA